MYFGLLISSLFIVLSTFNDNCSLNTFLMLKNEQLVTAPKTIESTQKNPKQVGLTARSSSFTGDDSDLFS